MALKTTLRLPDRVARKLRERSAAEGRSLNETAVRAIERGLDGRGEDDEEWWKGLGDLVEIPPSKEKLDWAAFLSRPEQRGLKLSREWVREAMEDFDRSREDRV